MDVRINTTSHDVTWPSWRLKYAATKFFQQPEHARSPQTTVIMMQGYEEKRQPMEHQIFAKTVLLYIHMTNAQICSRLFAKRGYGDIKTRLILIDRTERNISVYVWYPFKIMHTAAKIVKFLKYAVNFNFIPIIPHYILELFRVQYRL